MLQSIFCLKIAKKKKKYFIIILSVSGLTPLIFYYWIEIYESYLLQSYFLCSVNDDMEVNNRKTSNIKVSSCGSVTKWSWRESFLATDGSVILHGSFLTSSRHHTTRWRKFPFDRSVKYCKAFIEYFAHDQEAKIVLG